MKEFDECPQTCHRQGNAGQILHAEEKISIGFSGETGRSDYGTREKLSAERKSGEVRYKQPDLTFRVIRMENKITPGRL